ncbi:MAG: DUF3427 domain-containing protein [Comamonadaceae bacterium]|nr:DUF3427 domain-containing protein [Comamonadaceae bacterium]
MLTLPIGLYERLLSTELQQALAQLPAGQIPQLDTELGAEQQRRLLVQEIAQLLPQLLEAAQEREGEAQALSLFNRLLVWLRQQGVTAPSYAQPLRVLRAVHPEGQMPQLPSTGLSAPWLFTAGRADPSLYAELRAEIANADRIDVLVSFITWSGLRKIMDVLQAATALDAHGQPATRLRVITTTYTGATESAAVEKLAGLPGVELKISLDGQRSRLHAKAWMFHRKTGFGSAMVGSANLSAAALLNGIEWTVKFTQSGQAELFAAAEAHFETLWNDSEFQRFDPRDEAQRQQLRQALGEARQSGSSKVQALPTWFELRPRAFQQAMLERLESERRHGRWRNLLVAATGTGKTVVAAFDYLRQTQAAGGAPPRLLFVAHRIEILQQAMATFRQLLRQQSFGELLADGAQPASHQHLFASIASVLSRELLQRFGVDYWHTVIIDECHHLPAQSFSRFAQAVRPRILLGLTATPERADGASVLEFFDQRPDGSPATELRLWDALEQQLLCPFEYYATADDVDLQHIEWSGGPAERNELSKVLGADHARARRIIQALNDYTNQRQGVRAIAFCVDIAHASFMAERFNETGWSALAVTSRTSAEQRLAAPRLLAQGKVQILCTCDLYNEGVDIPDANTLLFLRPTQSPVVFAQQLGRGLRMAQGKESCLVLDFVGRVRQDFRFDRLYQAITGLGRRQLQLELEQGFASLPPGCHIQFDRVARQRVLDALRDVSRQSWRRLTGELLVYAQGRERSCIGLVDFLTEQCLEAGDVYSTTRSYSGWTALKRAAGLETRELGPDEPYLSKRMAALLHINDSERCTLLQRIGKGDHSLRSAHSGRVGRQLQMLAYQLFGQRNELMDGRGFLQRLDASPLIRDEMAELGQWLDLRVDLEAQYLPGVPEDWPLLLHGAYSRAEILSAIGFWNAQQRPPHDKGLQDFDELKLQLLFITLDKKTGFHERIAYHDYAISPELFHWQSQNRASPDNVSGKRYTESTDNGWRFQLFVRENADSPFIPLGPAVLEGEPTGSKPMSMVWRLQQTMPLELFRRFSVLRA